jgi:hypothetical protein
MIPQQAQEAMESGNTSCTAASGGRAEHPSQKREYQ